MRKQQISALEINWKQMTSYLYQFHMEASNKLSTFHNWGHSRGILHCSTLQNYVYPNPRSPSIDVGQETEASNINLDRSTDNPIPNYARVCLATPSKRQMDTSNNSDESELFGSPSYVDESPRTASHMKGRYLVPEAPREVRDEAQEALTAALDQVPDTSA